VRDARVMLDGTPCGYLHSGTRRVANEYGLRPDLDDAIWEANIDLTLGSGREAS
jgi:hypothetical protein